MGKDHQRQSRFGSGPEHPQRNVGSPMKHGQPVAVRPKSPPKGVSQQPSASSLTARRPQSRQGAWQVRMEHLSISRPHSVL
uniref:Uncharacterized protein n=1 Tax=Tetraselmis sp. GSL018 TaxID=582737 RepID=A0A061RKM1_9CHLO